MAPAYRDLSAGVTRRSEVEPGSGQEARPAAGGAQSASGGYRRARNFHGEVSVVTLRNLFTLVFVVTSNGEYGPEPDRTDKIPETKAPPFVARTTKVCSRRPPRAMAGR